MRAIGWLLVAGACNRSFDLAETYLPPPDAPFRCPDLGAVPMFSRVIVQSVEQYCDFYTTSADTRMGMAECFSPMSFIGYGPADDMLVPTAIPSDRRYPRLSPEGDLALLYRAVPTQAIELYTVGPQGLSLAGQIATTTSHFSTPSRAPRHLITFTRTDFFVHELVENGSWSEADRYPIPALGVTDAQDPMLSPDGLRLVFYGTLVGDLDYKILYADRPSVTARFANARAIAGAPAEYDPFLAEDCSRLYFSSADLQQVLYLRQL